MSTINFNHKFNQNETINFKWLIWLMLFVKFADREPLITLSTNSDRGTVAVHHVFHLTSEQRRMEEWDNMR